MNIVLPAMSSVKSARPLQLAILALAIVLMAALGAILTDVYTRVQTLRTSPKDNVQWTILQTQTEYLRMHEALHEVAPQNSESYAEFSKRFDIFYSRIELLKSAAVTDALRKNAEFAELLSRLVRFRDSSARDVDGGLNAFPAVRPALDTATEEAGKNVQALVLNAITQFAVQSDSERRQLATSMLLAAVLSTALVMALLASVASLRRRTIQLSRREAMLTESREKLASTIKAALDAVVISDASGTIIDWNEGAESVFGHTREVAIGAKMSTLMIPPKFRQAHDVGMARYLAAGEARVIGRRVEVEALHASGRVFPVEMTLGVSRGQGQPVFIAYLRDISDRVARDKALKAALQEAEAASESKARFLAVMSHEMRTPLNGVIGALDLLDSTQLDSEQHRLIETALRAGDELLTHISDVLDFSKMEAGKLDIERLPFRIETMLEGIVGVLSHVHPENNNQVSHSCFGGKRDAIVMGDEQRIRQVLLNLGTNAIKFTRGGSVSIYCVRAGNGNVRFSVTDTGVGIRPEDIGALFREFSMVDSSLRRSSGGTGLGLAICKRLVTAMGGRIGVESKPGQGSTFWFEVPLPESEEATAAEGSAEGDTGVTKRLRILLVEDNATNRFVGRKMLEGLGHSCELAENGSEAVDRLRTESFDTVLMDISMPVMDGLSAIKIIRKMSSAHKNLPVIAMTANAVAGDREKFLREGFTGYVAKPMRRADLARALGDCVRPPKQQSSGELLEGSVDAVLDVTTFSQLKSDVGHDALGIMIECFGNDVDLQLGRLEKAMAQQDRAEMKKAAHAISGIAGTIGANRLCHLATRIETEIGSIDPTELQSLGAYLRSAQVHTARELQAIVAPS